MSFDPEMAKLLALISNSTDDIAANTERSFEPTEKPKSIEGKFAMQFVKHRDINPSLTAHFINQHGGSKFAFKLFMEMLITWRDNLDAGLFYDETDRSLGLMADKMLKSLSRESSSPPLVEVGVKKTIPNPAKVWE